jgi:hypothetical protein
MSGTPYSEYKKILDGDLAEIRNLEEAAKTVN